MGSYEILRHSGEERIIKEETTRVENQDDRVD